MTVERRASVLFAAAALCSATLTAAQTIPGDGKSDNPNGSYFVKNATSMALRCHFRIGDAGWSAYRSIPPNGQFTRFVQQRGETIRFHCLAPVEQRAYRLRPGERYAILSYPDGVHKLVRVATR